MNFTYIDNYRIYNKGWYNQEYQFKTRKERDSYLESFGINKKFFTISRYFCTGYDFHFRLDTDRIESLYELKCRLKSEHNLDVSYDVCILFEQYIGLKDSEINLILEFLYELESLKIIKVVK